MPKYREIENPTADKVQVGDRVTFTIPGWVSYGEITARAYLDPWGYVKLAGYAKSVVDILKIERPVPTLPEEDGLYTIAHNEGSVTHSRVFRLWDGDWKELTPDTYGPFTGSLEDPVASRRWTLTRLVMEDSNAQ